MSIIVISKDDTPGLLRTLRSIQAQNQPAAEVVIVAAGTSSLADCDGLALRSTAIRQTSRGISNAFNEGLAAARGRWVNFLNGGDEYRHDKVLEQFWPSLLTGESSIIAARAIDLKTGVTIPRDKSFAARRVASISHQASFYRRDLFSRFGGYSDRFLIRMDFEWLLRLPDDIAVEWVDERMVAFEGGGISSVRPVEASIEECRALLQNRRNPLALASVLMLYLPFRSVRHCIRRLSARRCA